MSFSLRPCGGGPVHGRKARVGVFRLKGRTSPTENVSSDSVFGVCEPSVLETDTLLHQRQERALGCEHPTPIAGFRKPQRAGVSPARQNAWGYGPWQAGSLLVSRRDLGTLRPNCSRLTRRPRHHSSAPEVRVPQALPSSLLPRAPPNRCRDTARSLSRLEKLASSRRG